MTICVEHSIDDHPIATKWKEAPQLQGYGPHMPVQSLHQHKKEYVDLYDCRMREWYIQTAASPKDIVILLDISGSMTGLRKSIALNVVYTILDTLTDNDYVVTLQVKCQPISCNTL